MQSEEGSKSSHDPGISVTFTLWAMHKEGWFVKVYIIKKKMRDKKPGFKSLTAKQIMYFFSSFFSKTLMPSKWICISFWQFCNRKKIVSLWNFSQFAFLVLNYLLDFRQNIFLATLVKWKSDYQLLLLSSIRLKIKTTWAYHQLALSI